MEASGRKFRSPSKFKFYVVLFISLSVFMTVIVFATTRSYLVNYTHFEKHITAFININGDGRRDVSSDVSSNDVFSDVNVHARESASSGDDENYQAHPECDGGTNRKHYRVRPDVARPGDDPLNLRRFNAEIEAARTDVLRYIRGAGNQTNTQLPPRRNITEEVSAPDYFRSLENITWIKTVRLRATARPDGGLGVYRELRSPLFPPYMDEPCCKPRHGIEKVKCDTHTSHLNTTLCPRNTDHVWRNYVNKTDIFLTLVPNALISERGHVWSRDVYIVTNGCWMARIGPKNLESQKTKIPEYDEVFTLMQRHSYEYYHFNVETFPRLLPYVTFLRANPHVKVHVHPDKARHMREHLEMFGLDAARLVWPRDGRVRARVVYLPQGGGCFHTAPHPVTLALVSNAYLAYLRHTLPPPLSSSPRRSVILMERSGARQLVQHRQLAERLRDVTRAAGLDLVVFSDRNQTTFSETRRLFYRAAAVIGPHGAGFTNIIWSRAPTVVIEMRCTRVIMVYSMMSQVLGHRYFGVHPLDGSCEKGINVDVDHVINITQYAVKNKLYL